MARITIYIPPDLHDRMQALSDKAVRLGKRIKWSREAQRAFTLLIEEREREVLYKAVSPRAVRDLIRFP